jgi:hypothetical protein
MKKVDFKLTVREDIAPVCPFCEKELEEVYMKTKGLGLWTGKNVVYFCPHCLKVLGFGQSRMAAA